MARVSEGLTEQIGPRLQPEELGMLRDIAALLKMSQNRAVRYAIRYAWQHATSTTDHTRCSGTHPCASATRGLTPGRQRAAQTSGQTTITHAATAGE